MIVEFLKPLTFDLHFMAVMYSCFQILGQAFPIIRWIYRWW